MTDLIDDLTADVDQAEEKIDPEVLLADLAAVATWHRGRQKQKILSIAERVEKLLFPVKTIEAPAPVAAPVAPPTVQAPTSTSAGSTSTPSAATSPQPPAAAPSP